MPQGLIGGQGYQKTHISTNTSTNVRDVTGLTRGAYLHAVTINNPGTTTPTITVYDDHSGGTTTPIAIITPTAPITLFFDNFMSNGIQVVTASGGTAPDLTILWG